MSSLGASHVRGDMRRAVLRIKDIVRAHYPGLLKDLIVINAPYWVSTVVASFNSSRLGFNITCFSSESRALDEIRRVVEDDQIPEKLGGSSPYSFGEHPYHLLYRQSSLLIHQVRNAAPPLDSIASGQRIPLRSSSDRSAEPRTSGKRRRLSTPRMRLRRRYRKVEPRTGLT